MTDLKPIHKSKLPKGWELEGMSKDRTIISYIRQNPFGHVDIDMDVRDDFNDNKVILSVDKGKIMPDVQPIEKTSFHTPSESNHLALQFMRDVNAGKFDKSPGNVPSLHKQSWHKDKTHKKRKGGGHGH